MIVDFFGPWKIEKIFEDLNFKIWKQIQNISLIWSTNPNELKFIVKKLVGDCIFKNKT
jgi:hypothetical protein